MLRELTEQRLSRFRPGLEIPVDIFDQDHGGIDDDAEIDGADRQQIGVLVAQHQDDDAEEQRERDIDADNDGAAQIAEEQPLDEEDQQAAKDEIMQHRPGGDGDQRGAVVERHQFHAGRQAAVAVDLLDFRADARHHVVGVQRAVHDDDRRDHVIIVVAAGLAEPRHIADRDLGDIFHEHRHAVRLGQQDVLDVLDLVALGQIGGAAAVHQPDAADIHGLLAEIDGAAADIDIGVAERADHLRQRDIVGVEFVQIDVDVIFFGRAAPGIDLHDAGTVRSRRCKIQSWTVRRLVKPKCGGPTT